MRAVLDTNVLISGVIASGVPHEVVLSGYRGEYQIVVSIETLEEFRRTLLKYPDRFEMNRAEVQKEVETLRYFADFVDPAVEITEVEEDSDDDKFLEAGVAGNVEYVVSGDSHLLNVDRFRGIDIVSPRTFYEVLESK